MSLSAVVVMALRLRPAATSPDAHNESTGYTLLTVQGYLIRLPSGAGWGE